jgi:hypothetical protein
MRERPFNVQDYGARDPWPGLPVHFTATADVINDGKDISIKLPKEFAGHRMSCGRDKNNDWSWLLFLETGNEAGNKVQPGSGDNSYLRFSTSAITGLNIRPVANSFWNAKRIGSKILVGKLFTNLSFNNKSSSQRAYEMQFDRSRPRPIPKEYIDDYDDDEDDDDPAMIETDKPGLPELIMNTPVRPKADGPIADALKTAAKAKIEPEEAKVIITPPKPVASKLPLTLEPKKETAMPEAAQPTPPQPHVEMIKQALALLNNSIKSGQLEVSIKNDGTIGARVKTTVDL